MDLKLAKIKPDVPTSDLHVNMSNALIRAAQCLSLPEKRAVSLCMAKMDSVKLDNGRYKFRISAQEFAEQFDLDINTAYDQLQAVGKRLMRQVARTIEDTPRGKKERLWVWVSGVVYHHGEGWVELGFSHEMTPHLFLLRKEFTSYKLKHAAALRSVYSWRLLELLMQFKSTGLLRITVEDFCHAMEAPVSARKNFGQLRLRIIEPAVAELISKDNLLIEWEGTKRGGRKITGLEFRFKRNPQQSLI